MVDSVGLEAILNRLETGKRLSKQDLQILVTAVQSQQVTIATGDRAIAIGGSADGAVIVTGDRNFVVAGADAEAIRELMRKRARSESILLQAVEDEVTARLNQSLYEAVLIQLKLEAQPEQVKRFWDSDIKIGDQPAKPIPEDWNILKVFQEVKGKLLILGSPGAGKTTTMLELAQKLIIFSKEDEDFPIPVLFNLSTWRDSKQPIQDWLVSELKLKYGVRKDVAKKWVNDTKLLPMLDGLDELESARQEPCIEAINQLLKSDCRPQYFVVCSRWEEYSIHSNKLLLNGATSIRELTNLQIQNYLKTLGRESLYLNLQKNSTLLEILRTPLFINIALLSEEELLIDEWKKIKTSDKRRDYLMTAYVKRMLERKLVSEAFPTNAPNSGKIKQQLSWLAQQLQRESSTEFLIERIRPTWLQTYSQKLLYSITTCLIYCVAVLSLISLFSPLHITDGIIIGLVDGLIMGLINSLALEKESFELIETFNFQLSTATYKAIFFIWTFFTISDGVSDTSYDNVNSAFSSLGSEIELKLSPNQGIFKTIKNIVQSLLFVFLYFLITVCYMYLGHLLTSLSKPGSLQEILIFVVYAFVGLVFLASNLVFRMGVVIVGSQSCIQHFIVRLILYFNGYISWDCALFLNYCTDRLLLQRVGGRYRFIHRLLQEYFAALPLGKVKGDR